MMTTKNFQLFFIGKTVAEMIAALGMKPSEYNTTKGNHIDRRRLGAKIVAIRRKKAWACNIHVIAADGEWITIKLYSATEAYVCGLSASQKERVWMFGTDAAAKYPRPLND